MRNEGVEEEEVEGRWRWSSVARKWKRGHRRKGDDGGRREEVEEVLRAQGRR